MTKPLDQTEGLSAPDVKVLTDVKETGWHTVGVFPNDGQEGGDWAFSVGLLHTFGHPEVALFGLPLNRCVDIVNVIGTDIKGGREFRAGEDYGDVLRDPYKCTFRRVNRNHYRDYFGYALWFYENDSFPILQCFWPDKKDQFPWDEACNNYVKKVQPLLYVP